MKLRPNEPAFRGPHRGRGDLGRGRKRVSCGIHRLGTAPASPWGTAGGSAAAYQVLCRANLRPGEIGATLPAVSLGPGRTALQVSAGNAHTCARLDDRSAKCWGRNDFGQLGLGDTSSTLLGLQQAIQSHLPRTPPGQQNRPIRVPPSYAYRHTVLQMVDVPHVGHCWEAPGDATLTGGQHITPDSPVVLNKDNGSNPRGGETLAWCPRRPGWTTLESDASGEGSRKNMVVWWWMSPRSCPMARRSSCYLSTMISTRRNAHACCKRSMTASRTLSAATTWTASTSLRR